MITTLATVTEPGNLGWSDAKLLGKGPAGFAAGPNKCHIAIAQLGSGMPLPHKSSTMTEGVGGVLGGSPRHDMWGINAPGVSAQVSGAALAKVWRDSVGQQQHSYVHLHVPPVQRHRPVSALALKRMGYALICRLGSQSQESGRQPAQCITTTAWTGVRRAVFTDASQVGPAYASLMRRPVTVVKSATSLHWGPRPRSKSILASPEGT